MIKFKLKKEQIEFLKKTYPDNKLIQRVLSFEKEGIFEMDDENKNFVLAGKEYHEGDWLSIDGSTGCIYDGIIPTVDATIAGELGRIMGWAD